MQAHLCRMSERVVSGTARVWQLAAMTLVAAGCVAILSTARVFSGTVDEPAHIWLPVMQWLSTGQYDYDLQHPPLGRIAARDRTVFARSAHVRGAGGV